MSHCFNYIVNIITIVLGITVIYIYNCKVLYCIGIYYSSIYTIYSGIGKLGEPGGSCVYIGIYNTR